MSKDHLNYYMVGHIISDELIRQGAGSWPIGSFPYSAIISNFGSPPATITIGNYCFSGHYLLDGLTITAIVIYQF